MLLYIITDRNNNKDQYVYYDNKKLYGYSLDASGYQKPDRKLNEKVWSLLRGKFLRYVSKYKEYDIFLDENNYKHFYKDGKENFRLFMEANGKEYVFYSNGKNSKKIKSIVKEFVIAGIVILLGVTTFKLYESEINDIFSKSNLFIVEVSEYYAGNDIIDAETAIDLVNSNDNVEILQNDLLLQTIFPYYKNSKMEYLIKERLTDLHFSYYDQEEHDSGGYYDVLQPNTLNISNVEKDSSWVKRHEFGHLLQDVSIEERVIIEAMADIITKEYYDDAFEGSGYYFLNRDTYMLAAIIGPESFYQMVYSGNTEPFYQAIEPYLAPEEMEAFKSVLRTIPKEKDVNHEYEEFIKIIYKNKYKQDMMDDDFMKCLFTDLSFFERVYMFNPYKVDQEQFIQITDDVANDLAAGLHNVEYHDGHYYIRVNLYDQFREQYERIKSNKPNAYVKTNN